MKKRILDLETNTIIEEEIKEGYKYFKGVSFYKRYCQFQVYVRMNKKQMFICHCDNLEDAIKISIKAHEHYGLPI